MSSKISQVDLAIDSSELAYVAEAIERRWLTEGPFADKLKDQVRTRLGVKHVLFAPNGTLGLYLALLGLDLPRESEIIIPSFTFYGSAMAAVFAGLKPVFVDCDPETFNVTAEAIESAITPATRAVMPVHLFGQCCDIENIVSLAEKRGLKIVEDAAQAFGVSSNSKAAGTFGDVGVFSLFSDKIITAGEGGILVTNNDDLNARLSLLRNQGRPNSGTFTHPELGMNFRITDLQAGIALAQLEKLDGLVLERRRKWALYEDLLAGIGDVRAMRLSKSTSLAPFRYPILTVQRDQVLAALEAEGVQTRGFFLPMHLQPKLRQTVPQSLPVAEGLHQQGICLPIHAHIDDAAIIRICTLISGVFR